MRALEKDEKPTIKNLTDARNFYREICLGYTPIFLGQKEEDSEDSEVGEYYYIRHLTEIESSKLLLVSEKYENIAKKRGLLTEEEKLKELDEAGAWTKADEEKKNNLYDNLQFAMAQKAKLVLKSQQELAEKDIKQKQNEIQEFTKIRTELLDLTVESYASKKMSKHHVFVSFFKDEKLTKPLFKEEEYDDWEEEDLWDYIILHGSALRWYTDDANFKKTVVWPFFLNNFFTCGDDTTPFFAKPVCDLTQYQGDLLSAGRWVKSILTQTDKTPPQELYKDLSELIKWYYIQNAKANSKKQGKSSEKTSRGEMRRNRQG